MTPLEPTYAFPRKALQRWTREHLRVTPEPAGGGVAEFEFAGSTCGNVPFRYLLSVRFDEATVIRELRSGPGRFEENHVRQCSWAESATWDVTARPCVGRTLDEALAWRPRVSPAGCLCSEASRAHKWLVLLHTLHFACQAERGAPAAVSVRQPPAVEERRHDHARLTSASSAPSAVAASTSGSAAQREDSSP